MQASRGRERNDGTRLFVLATRISGVAAAYVMYRRGELLGVIAKKTITNVIGVLAPEVGVDKSL